MINVSIPTTLEVESFEVNLVNVDVSLESDGLDRLIWVSVWVISEVMSVDSNMVVSSMNFDGQMEVLRVVKGVLVTEFWSPHSVELGVHSDNVLMMEAEVDMENNVWSTQQFNSKVFVMSMTDMSVDGNGGSVLKGLKDRESSWDIGVVIGVHGG